MIKVIFTNGTTAVDLQFVRNVQWETDIDSNVLVSPTTRVGKATRTLVINGFINKGIFTDNVKAQQQLESDLISVGTGTIQYTGANDITNVRFSSLQFEEFRGNPICPFTINFVTEDPNIHAHSPVRINSLTLDAANGYDNVRVTESTTTQGPDEQLLNNLSKVITISGSIVGNSLTDINTKQQALVTEIDNTNSITLTLSATSGNYIATIVVRPRKLDFNAPRLRGELAARDFTAEFATYEDYTKEPYTLGEIPVTIGGITIDVVNGFDHNKEYEYSSVSGAYTILDENVEIGGKKYFSNYDSYSTFRQLFTPIPNNTYLYTSNTSNVLQLVDITVGEFQRDGNFPDTTKRYSASVTLSFNWRKSLEQTNYSVLTNYFGVVFYKVPGISFSATVDQYGNVTSRSVNISGEIKGESQLNNFKALLGTSVNYDASLTNLYVTSANVSSVNTVNDNGTAVKVYNVSLSAAQLDTASQANYFIAGLFDMSSAGSTAGTIQFEAITSLSKSISNRFDAFQQRFIVTSISISVSGDVLTPDSGAGKPSDANKMVNLFNRVDSLSNNGLSIRGATQHTSNQLGFNILSAGDSGKYMINNISVGDWQPAVAPENIPGSGITKGTRYWKQNVSISAIAVYDLSDGGAGGNNEPDYVDTFSESVDEETPRFTQLQVLNFGTVFKRTGTNPSRCTVTSQRQYRDSAVYQPEQYGNGNTRPSPRTWAGRNRSNVIARETRENNPPSNSWTVEYEATEKIST